MLDGRALHFHISPLNSTDWNMVYRFWWLSPHRGGILGGRRQREGVSNKQKVGKNSYFLLYLVIYMHNLYYLWKEERRGNRAKCGKNFGIWPGPWCGEPASMEGGGGSPHPFPILDNPVVITLEQAKLRKSSTYKHASSLQSLPNIYTKYTVFRPCSFVFLMENWVTTPSPILNRKFE